MKCSSEILYFRTNIKEVHSHPYTFTIPSHHMQPQASTTMLGNVFCVALLLLSMYASCSDENWVAVQQGTSSKLLLFELFRWIMYFCNDKNIVFSLNSTFPANLLSVRTYPYYWIVIRSTQCYSSCRSAWTTAKIRMIT